MHTRSGSSAGAQLLDINCSVLDSLVLDYLSKAQLVEDTAQETDDNCMNRIAALTAYQQLHQGNVCNAMAIVYKYCPDILQDQRLQFRLKRQRFIELLRKSSAAGDAAALACARDELAPLALDAYPEAYLDFKRALLMLVQQHQHQDWSLEARYQLAEMLYHTMLQHLGVRSPQLSQLVVYLTHLFNAYSSGSHGSSRGAGVQIQQLLQAPGADLAKGLLLEGRQAGPLPVEISGRGNVERDVQALMAAVGIPRQTALDALKAAAGDANAALAAELMRFNLNLKQLDALAWDYAATRGLLEPSDSPTAADAAPTDGPAAAAPSDMDIDQASSAAAAAAAAGAGSAGAGSSSTSKAQKRSNGSSSCSTFGAASLSPFTGAGPHLQHVSCVATAAGGSVAAALLRSESQSPPYKVPRWRCKQTASRLHWQVPTSAGPGSVGRQQHDSASKRLGEPEVVMDCAGGPSRTSTAAASGSGSGSGLAKQQQAEQQQQGKQQQQQQPAEAVDLKCSSQHAVAEQLVEATRIEMQQQRWQQLQQSLKSQAASGSSSSGSGGSAARQQEVQQLLLQLPALSSEGRWSDLEALVEDLQPGLLQEHHVLQFDLKRYQFMQLIQDGHLPAALQFARSLLTPLADKHPELLPSLKATMALLLPGPSGLTSGGTSGVSGSRHAAGEDDSSNNLQQRLLSLLQSTLGVEPPMLVKLLMVLVTGHKAWFKLQRCQDPFATVVGLDKLLQVETTAAAKGPCSTAGGTSADRTAAVPGTAGAASAAVSLGGLLHETEPLLDYELEVLSDDDEGMHFDEAEVLLVMEVLELPRATALELLADHGGDAQAVIMQVFGA